MPDGGDNRLDLAAKLSQESVLPVVRRVAAGQKAAAPLVVELDPTSFCDLACPECISGPLLQQGRFDSERLSALGDELAEAGVRAVILIGGGEPLLHPVVGELIADLATRGVAVGLTTNGTQLRRYMEPISAHVAWTRVSVDAASAGVYDRLRPHRGGRSAFAAVIDGMRELAKRKRGDLGFSFLLISRRDDAGTVTASNLAELLPAAELAREIGCDYFEVKPEYDSSHFLCDHPRDTLERLGEDLHSVKELSREGFEVIAPTNLDALLGRGPLRQPKEYDRCPVAELRTLLTPTGAYMCPYHRGSPKARYGDPTEERFADIWAGSERERAIGAIAPSSDCQFHCIRHESNLSILRSAAENSWPEPVSADYDPFI